MMRGALDIRSAFVVFGQSIYELGDVGFGAYWREGFVAEVQRLNSSGLVALD